MRVIIKGSAWILGLAVLVVVAWFGINATDESLSDEARAAMSVPPAPAPSERNGFLDFLVLGAPEDVPIYERALKHLHALNNQHEGKSPPVPGEEAYSRDLDKQVPRCYSSKSSCLEDAAAHPNLQDLIDRHQPFLRRYRAMREKPEFVDLFEIRSPEDSLPAYERLFDGKHLMLLGAALQFNAGNRESAIRELELEQDFARKVAIGSRSLLQKLVAFYALDMDALFLAEIARKVPPGDRALWSRIEALVRAPTKEELDVVPALRREIALYVRSMQTRRYVRLPDSYYEMANNLPGHAIGTRPWWDPIAPYLYRPHQTVNLFAARSRIDLSLAEHPAAQFFEAREAARRQGKALEPGLLARFILNPVGHRHDYLHNVGDPDDVRPYPDYIARTHGHAGVQTLVRLQVTLRAAGLSKPDEIAAALAGPLGSSHPDPFTGVPMRFDPRTNTIGFESRERYHSYPVRELVKRHGRMALPI